MKLFYVLILTLAPLGFTNNASALTLAECEKTGGKCLCVSFPGAETVCTRAKGPSLQEFVKNSERQGPIYKVLSRI